MIGYKNIYQIEKLIPPPRIWEGKEVIEKRTFHRRIVKNKIDLITILSLFLICTSIILLIIK